MIQSRIGLFIAVRYRKAMRKLPFFLFLTICLMTLSYSYSQSPDIGIKGGLNMANLHHDNSSINPDHKAGLHGGILVHFHVNRSFGVQPELVYSMQGADYGGGEAEINYVNVPLLFQYMFASGWRLQTGPQVGLLVSGEFDENDGREVNIKSSLKKSVFDWSLGAGYLSASGLGVDLRYNHGISDAYKNSDVTNRVWQLGLFYQFRVR